MIAQGRLAPGVRMVVLGVALAVLPASGAVASAQTMWPDQSMRDGGACRMSLLPVPAGAVNSEVTGGDHTGRYLVGQATEFDGTNFSLASLLWTDGVLRKLATEALAPAAQVNVTDVNSRGAVVGYRTRDFGTFHTDAWIYRKGGFTLLPGLKPSDATTTAAINARGDIVGTSEDRSVSPVVSHAVIWPANQPGTVRELTVNGASPAWATGVDIDDDGTALGLLGQRSTPDQRPYVWPAHGRSYALNPPAGTGYPEGVAIHEGWVAGTVMSDGSSAVVRWNLRAGAATVISTSHGSAFAVNRDGTVAAFGALIYRNGHVRELGATAKPTVLSDRRTAAGSDAPFSGNAVIWTGC